jgi:G3E family GTPase
VDFDLASLLAGRRADPATRLAEVKSWFGAQDGPASGHHDHGEHENHTDDGPHDPHARTFAVRAAAPIEWPALAICLNSLVRRQGSKILRIKGLLIIGAPGPVVLHCIQHVIHPPVRLEAWPDADTSSRIVFVVQGIDPRPIQESLKGLLERRQVVRGEGGSLP